MSGVRQQLLSKNKINKNKVPSENQIQSSVREYLQCYGWYVIRHHQSLGSFKGMSDLTAIKNGRTVYIECKTPKGKLSGYQSEFQEEIERHGGLYVVARSIDDVKFLCEKSYGGNCKN